MNYVLEKKNRRTMALINLFKLACAIIRNVIRFTFLHLHGLQNLLKIIMHYIVWIKSNGRLNKNIFIIMTKNNLRLGRNFKWPLFLSGMSDSQGYPVIHSLMMDELNILCFLVFFKLIIWYFYFSENVTCIFLQERNYKKLYLFKTEKKAKSFSLFKF